MTQTKTLTATGRLDLLLSWLNGDLDEYVWGPNPLYGQRGGEGPEDFVIKTDFPAIRLALAEFVQSFDGSAAAAHLEVIDDPAPAHVRRRHPEPTDDELGDLEAVLRILLSQGLSDGLLGNLGDLSIPMAALRLSVRHAGRKKPGKRSGKRGSIDGGVMAQRHYLAPGAYVLQVQGPLLELVPFLVAHLLTAPNMVVVRRCPRAGCSHFVITATTKPGRPKSFCSDACQKQNAKQLEQQRKKRKRQGRES